MLVKTFEAVDMSEALRMVKAELGPDAMIISSKKERKKGFLGFFSKPVIKVTAALEVKPRQPAPNPYREAQEQHLSAKEMLENSMLAPLARELKDLRLKVEQMTRQEAEAKAKAAEAQSREESAAAAEAPAAREFNPRSIPKQDLEEMKKILFKTLAAKEAGAEQSAEKADADPAPAKAPQTETEKASGGIKAALRVVVTELHRKGLERGAIRAVMDHLKPEARKGGTVEAIRSFLPQAFKSAIKCSGPLTVKKNGPRIIALVGPTGVGKTTTIAKLAAHYALREGHRAALITIDNFRVGAVEQLKTYSRIMGVPVEVAATAAELEAAIELHSDKELILIDTAGRSHKDSEKIEELKGFLESRFAIEIHLCLAATTRDREVLEIVERFGVLSVSRVIFTKLDESESYGSIVNAHLRTKFPLSYFTTGQRVPEDLEIATPGRLAGLVLGESKQ
ncbi:flagellar biosynthesis protein FlhF [Geobacter sulfurreducens]|jgi:flagellar biosynthesis protein FlhF|uniref:Flagellar biosynthesis protein FlhF n=1 Tax=Geobacter sulfurreducens (strain ATCC 51573 / DSM 12127 / PCA) TaxID=243231 RepID=Q3V8C7_GEOSL|nr:flagellar biosynthesis protein FlhF [Geobacter sulfurreducens]AAR36447.2 flagellar biogenesis protein FlhF [Geobacter sulfurreducens PCA]ADI85806.1 flagellar biogenesis protein FlhF [Geobacter sulfurreducens KN400]AJY69299.1 flagellar biosynthesis protein FlhF [Geobacter sulfurreducens]QVW34853.1 flagellar biosynthesis protein FlhF [Geobacter sulfurreducens]UAC03723.1 flagellar biosynthesis protein FlhF [Geobacter sulfurreducens]